MQSRTIAVAVAIALALCAPCGAKSQKATLGELERFGLDCQVYLSEANAAVASAAALTVSADTAILLDRQDAMRGKGVVVAQNKAIEEYMAEIAGFSANMEALRVICESLTRAAKADTTGAANAVAAAAAGAVPIAESLKGATIRGTQLEGVSQAVSGVANILIRHHQRRATNEVLRKSLASVARSIALIRRGIDLIGEGAEADTRVILVVRSRRLAERFDSGPQGEEWASDRQTLLSLGVPAPWHKLRSQGAILAAQLKEIEEPK